MNRLLSFLFAVVTSYAGSRVRNDANGLLYMQARFYNPYLCRFINADPSGFGGGLNFYAAFNGNPVSLADPFGLGAVQAATGGSWMDQIWSGLGVNNSLAAQVNREQALVGAVNFATMGLANDAASVISGAASTLTGGNGLGYDLAGNPTTRQQQTVSAVMLGAALIPGGDLETTAGRAGLELGEAVAETAPRPSTSVIFRLA